MYITPQKQSTSSKSHVALMLCGLVIAVLIGVALISGWRWYLRQVAERQRFAKLSVVADEYLSQRAAAESARIKASTRSATTLPSPVIPNSEPESLTDSTKPAVSLTNLPSSSEEAVFTDPIPLSEDVEPDRLGQAKELQKQFWAATKWEDKLPLVAESERVRPLMKDFYEDQKNTDPVAGNANHQAHFKLNNTEVLLFSYSSPRPGGTLDMALVATEKGKFSIDWESYVGASEVSWSAFKRERGNTPKLFRVFANQDDYYNYEFTDEKRFLAFHLSSPDGFYFVKGYCERTSTIGRTLTALFTSGAPRMALTLRLAFPEKALSDHCVQIVGVVANRWLIVP